MAQAREVSGVDHSEYGILAIAMVAAIVATLSIGFTVLLSVTWHFPVPFTLAISPLPWIVFFAVAHALVFRGRHQLSRQTRTKLLLFVPSLGAQVSQLTVYPVYSALFGAANEWQRLVLVAVFPGIKYMFKRSIFTFSRHLGDFAREMAGAGVEICASMYQATIMQGTPSPLVTAAVIGLDVVISVVEIRRHLERRSVVPTNEVVDRALGMLVDPSRPPIHDHDLARFGTRTRSLTASALSVTNSIKRVVSLPSIKRPTIQVAPSTSPVMGIIKPPVVQKDSLILVHALEILQSAESILLSEYFEVIVPLTNAWYFLVASQLPSAMYSPTLVEFFFAPSLLGPAMLNILLYTLLQGLTFVGVSVAMRVRYRLSALELLAFVMETHTWSLLGKLTSWFVIMLVFPIVHYGVDFTFHFHYTIRTS